MIGKIGSWEDRCLNRKEMVVWKGFVEESKQYMNYPSYWKEWNAHPYKSDGWTLASKCKAAIRFWLRFPGAWFRFHWLALSDLLGRSVSILNRKGIDGT